MGVQVFRDFLALHKSVDYNRACTPLHLSSKMRIRWGQNDFDACKHSQNMRP
ncbi:uncharacterized protein PHALS_12871 [Plasmopara halstedii]|uniref:Uncharacterized protein n=1 Tax=Plasmopara halstedii TaxID=4781 RepID=A0A0P1ANK1_PLAHL|nr:uncharacterized protein PHALS_12871 [Plasmopara halstedii]CEG42609.1 hypothetical protein PHALS_12871 [Plasmopara halstedii]|eukprot:XP_024578978.1 hypothetical protein PHALS_12871 [Plasmopara halstedii]